MIGVTIKTISIPTGTANVFEVLGTAMVGYLAYHKKEIIKLINSGAFELKNGKVIIHKDNDGVIRRIERIDVAYNS